MRMVETVSFKTIYRLNRRKNPEREELYLMEFGSDDLEDEFGFGGKYSEKAKLHEVQKIRGIIQQSQVQQISSKGEESNPRYTGYFCPEFILNTSKVADYRIKYVRPHETLILKITEYNQNLFLKGKRDHIQLELILEKKYEEQ